MTLTKSKVVKRGDCVAKRIRVICKFGPDIRVCGVGTIMFYFFCKFTFYLPAICNGKKHCLNLKKKTCLYNLYIFFVKMKET